MKTIIQAFVLSFVIHVLYIGGTFVVGYIQTLNYHPDIAHKWESIDTLQNEVALRMVGSPLYYVLTFIGCALFCGLIIYGYEKSVR
ncbi:hypothetical protein LS684_09690 [Cytobacillus spongiae]|uniref:hypothetical protein n=1 Tax=Cytobacillus spongiae TaxID=2901381 RepID=UPI001F15B381|nr:hypothetical protein [Cytobacillus spongiae]UII57666.1 hypothetical protein LS684_09690 [Cytobacillus spongiae]